MLAGKVLPRRRPGEGSQNGKRKNPRDGYRRSLRGDSTRMSSQSYQDSLTTTSPFIPNQPYPSGHRRHKCAAVSPSVLALGVT
jgi:hypothetical protein